MILFGLEEHLPILAWQQAKDSGEAGTARKRTHITIQTDRVLMIRRSTHSRVWCQKCGAAVDAVDVVQAQALAGNAQPLLQHDADAEKQRWHLLEGAGGTAMVCLDSVLKSTG